MIEVRGHRRQYLGQCVDLETRTGSWIFGQMSWRVLQLDGHGPAFDTLDCVPLQHVELLARRRPLQSGQEGRSVVGGLLKHEVSRDLRPLSCGEVVMYACCACPCPCVWGALQWETYV